MHINTLKPLGMSILFLLLAWLLRANFRFSQLITLHGRLVGWGRGTLKGWHWSPSFFILTLSRMIKVSKYLKSLHKVGVELKSVVWYFCHVLGSVSVHLFDHSGMSGSSESRGLSTCNTTTAHPWPLQPG